MIRISTESISQGDWTELVAEFEGHNLLQSWEYGEARAETSAWQIERIQLTDFCSNRSMLVWEQEEVLQDIVLTVY